MDKKSKLLTRHPCYSKEASKKYGRIHLPVAPRCNISCNYCNRKYDCSNECRPGVTSKVLSPEEAAARVTHIRKGNPFLSTVGIAGPGDSLANPEKTFRTLELIREEHPHLNLCISTNGLMLPEYVDQLVDLNAIYITVTVNAVDVEAAARVYRRVWFEGRNRYGEEGARILLERQREGIAKLQEKGAIVKINTVYIPEVNDDQIRKVADMASSYGAYLMNVTPMIPVGGAVFESHRAPSILEVETSRMEIGDTMRIMDHCQQCRSDSCGLLTDKKSSTLDMEMERLSSFNAASKEEASAGAKFTSEQMIGSSA